MGTLEWDLAAGSLCLFYAQQSQQGVGFKVGT